MAVLFIPGRWLPHFIWKLHISCYDPSLVILHDTNMAEMQCNFRSNQSLFTPDLTSFSLLLWLIVVLQISGVTVSVCTTRVSAPRQNFRKKKCVCLRPHGRSVNFYGGNRTHYTINQSTVWYDTQLTNHSLTTVIVFRCRNYPDSFLATFICFQIYRATTMLFPYALALLPIE